MKIQSCSLTADSLKGAIVSYADGTEMGVIVDISFNLDHHAVVVMIRQKDNGISGIPWEAMKNWRISLSLKHGRTILMLTSMKCPTP